MMLEDIYNFLPLSDRLLTSGMPTADQLADASKAGVRVVINLAPFDPARDLAGDEALVKSLGMAYINIPVEWEHPTRQNLEEFMDAMDAHQRDKLLVHCRANYRVSGFISLYRILRQGWTRENALKDLRRIWNPDDYPIWKKFIEDNISLSPPK
jgi:protein tyrosine phosphatase (PTP) superfamily phosphohydrolase (DUF442 family)